MFENALAVATGKSAAVMALVPFAPPPPELVSGAAARFVLVGMSKKQSSLLSCKTYYDMS
jgi:hypothetical protein